MSTPWRYHNTMKPCNDRIEFYSKHIKGLSHTPYQGLNNKRWGWMVSVDYKGHCVLGFSKLSPKRAKANAKRTIANLRKMPLLTEEHRMLWLARKL